MAGNSTAVDVSNARIREEIASALSKFDQAGFIPGVKGLLSVLGYSSERTLPGQTGSVDEFIDRFPARRLGTTTESDLRENVASVEIVFQLTASEISEAGYQASFGDTDGFDGSILNSFMFIAVELTGEDYPRGRYTQFTREINKRLSIASVILFRTSTGHLTLSFVHRRPNKLDPRRSVLGRVSLIREVNPARAHRAHLDILSELSLDNRMKWIVDDNQSSNFHGLLASWLNALDTEELNRRFYQDLFGWFIRVVEEARFPSSGTKTLSSEEHAIRLITRLLFVWFIKEKGLIDAGLFNEVQVGKLLSAYDRDSGDSYYRAVLQNLFFATLNTEIGHRRFRDSGDALEQGYTLYRFRNEIADENRLMDLFSQTPFVNGGLFDCLDSYDEEGRAHLVDCFSEDYKHELSIPDRLFFDPNERTPGVVPLFDRYKFTVEENTPAEQEVALDPELLGKVFENLLAAYNPETRETARKQTGSYYTPRAVVDYMVDEALVVALAKRVATNGDNQKWWEDRLHYLLDYTDGDDAAEFFEDSETEEIVRAIADLKVLDPAVGSGAFPMGVLHKLTLALRRLDPRNELWEKLQRDLAGGRAAAAFDTLEQPDLEARLMDISDTFQQYRDSDFGRKLYLIQNSIFGVDIQPVATQIAKLRFFISLAIEQKREPAAENYGIYPLPNLETRFVAADTLMGLGQASQIPLGGENRVTDLNNDLRRNRERHFHAGARKEKLRLRSEDARLRAELASEMQKAGMSKADTGKIAGWDPYDQNAKAEWFDASYMFAVRGGFDVVIGNPPYVESRNSLLSADAKDAYIGQVRADWSAVIPRGSDLLIYFLARTARVLSSEGLACLITQNGWLSTNYGKSFQDFSQGRFYFHRIIDTSARFFSDIQGPNVNAIIVLFSRQARRNIEYQVADDEMSVTPLRSIRSQQEMKWGHLFVMPEFLEHILGKLRDRESQTLRSGIEFGQGINVRKSVINAPGANVPTLLNPARFVATMADSAVLKSAIGKRSGKVPALIMPRGLGRYYCAFNSCKAHSFSGVDLYLPQDLWESDMHYCLWVFLNSSVAWLFREVTGRRNLGGGMLKAEATDMKSLPIGFPFDFTEVAKDLYGNLKLREPLSVQEEIYTTEHLAIDEVVGEFFGFSEYLEEIREGLLERVNLRESRARRRN